MMPRGLVFQYQPFALDGMANCQSRFSQLSFALVKTDFSSVTSCPLHSKTINPKLVHLSIIGSIGCDILSRPCGL